MSGICWVLVKERVSYVYDSHEINSRTYIYIYKTLLLYNSCHPLADLQCTKMGPLFGLWVDIILLWKASMGVA